MKRRTLYLIRWCTAVGKRIARAAWTVTTDQRIPRWRRVIFAPLALFAALPIPGPVDEIAGVLAFGLALVLMPTETLEAWQAACTRYPLPAWGVGK